MKLRNIGATTRLVDGAIQTLFTKGSVTIVGDFSKKFDYRGMSNIIDASDDIPVRDVLKGFIMILQRRLEIEHKATFIHSELNAVHPRQLYILKKETLSFVHYRIAKVNKVLQDE